MVNIKTIFCSTDLSTESDEAMRYAIALAKAHGARVIVYHCAEVPPMAATEEVLSRVTETIKRHVGWIDVDGIEWTPAIGIVDRNTGSRAAAIVREAALRQADLIIMQSRRGPLSAALFGSTPEEVCHRATCPVLVTHPKEHEFIDLKTKEVHLGKILVADDFSKFSTEALRFGFSIAQKHQAELHVLNIFPQASEKGMDKGEERGSQGDAQEMIQARLKNHIPEEVTLWCAVKTAVKEGKPEHEIIEYAKAQEIDLICIGTHGAGKGWSDLLGSTADRILRQAPCPVVVARPVNLD
ncbi:MAG TPA: universal stress protein [Blastocatellia bacterium]|nr:universal stress protein [Blastocatellia bacterium]